jgi:hypothetical protein
MATAERAARVVRTRAALLNSGTELEVEVLVAETPVLDELFEMLVVEVLVEGVEALPDPKAA